jgi:hypothetical protein
MQLWNCFVSLLSGSSLAEPSATFYCTASPPLLFGSSGSCVDFFVLDQLDKSSEVDRKRLSPPLQHFMRSQLIRQVVQYCQKNLLNKIYKIRLRVDQDSIQVPFVLHSCRTASFDHRDIEAGVLIVLH